MTLKENIQRYRDIIRSMIRTRFGSRSRLDDASYNADGMATWRKAAGFLHSESFQKAYKRGEESGHNIGQGRHLHIEWRVHIAICMAIHGCKLQGDFVECGVNTGIMSLAICDYLNFKDLPKTFYLFDTFSGIPKDQITEEEAALGRHAEEKLYFECYDITKSNFKDFPNVKLIKGKVPDTLPLAPIDKVSYLHLDMNIVEPERAAIEYFWDKLSPGAPVLLDDYGWKGFLPQRRAMDEFAQSKSCAICELPTGQGLLLKP